MSLLSSFVISHLIPALENAFIQHEPEAQQLLLSEIKQLSDVVSSWLHNKLVANNQKSSAE